MLRALHRITYRVRLLSIRKHQNETGVLYHFVRLEKKIHKIKSGNMVSGLVYTQYRIKQKRLVYFQASINVQIFKQKSIALW